MTIIRSTEPQGRFVVCYATYTEVSVSMGDFDHCGFCDTNGADIDREMSCWQLTDLLKFRYCQFEGDGSKVPRWITATADFLQLQQGFWQDLVDNDSDIIGAEVSIHRPDWITDSSWLRVCKLLGWFNRY